MRRAPHGAWGIVALLCLAVHTLAAEPTSIDTNATGTPPAPATRALATTRVRSLEPDVVELVDNGQRKSPTLKRLIQAIDQSDLLVYVHRFMRLSVSGGGLEVMGAANGQRVVFVLINPGLSPAHATAMIAHELQHAMEIATAPDVVDRTSLARHYARIGERSGFGRVQSYDTAAARAVEDVVLGELLGKQEGDPRDNTNVGS